MSFQAKIFTAVLAGFFIAAVILMSILTAKEDQRYITTCEKAGGRPYVGDGIRLCARPGDLLEIDPDKDQDTKNKLKK